MQDYGLSTEEIQNLKAAHKTSKQVSAYTAYRIHVIILLGMGMTPAEVSEIILLDEDTVRTNGAKIRNRTTQLLYKKLLVFAEVERVLVCV